MTKRRQPQDVFNAYAQLSKRQRLKLLGIACVYAQGTSFGEPGDLLHEALLRCADGRRRWAEHVDFEAHMALSMRSIASSDRMLHANSRRAHASPDEFMEWSECFGAHDSAELEYARIQEAASLFRIMAKARAEWSEQGDWLAPKVMDGLIFGWDPTEIALEAGVAVTEARVAKKRVLRKLSHFARL
jgi:DNA-directed RNA polymerase specialized sigma24 family protein